MGTERAEGAPPDSTAATACAICGGRRGAVAIASEKMFGLGGTFRYFECDDCGCLQLIDVPEDLAPYYPAHYYSFERRTTKPPVGGLKGWLRRRGQAAVLFDRAGPWRWLANEREAERAARHRGLFRHCATRSLEMQILDVGCGSGALLRELRRMGFDHLLGVDPYGEDWSDPSGGLRIVKGSLESLASRRFDLIMFHHVLEHMRDPQRTLATAARMLAPNGCCLVRVPLASCELRQQYGTDWVELDAPRHLWLHTPRSLGLLAASAGLRIEAVEYDANPSHHWGSELYRRGLSLHDPETGRRREPQDHFTPDELAGFEALARETNARGVGSRAAFYLVAKDRARG